MSQTDLEIWLEVLAGDNKAWEELVRRYQSLVYTVGIRAGLSLADAADCFQETWVQLYKNRKSLRNPSRLSAWLVTTAKREAIRLRKIAKNSSSEIENPAWNDPRPLPDEVIEQIERQAQLEIALGKLEPRCRKVMEMFFFAPEEKSYEEISESLGISFNSLGPIRRRCLEKLKNILIHLGYLEERKSKDNTL